jgi:3-oxoacyl-[acyl-carrier protein] reductase
MARQVVITGGGTGIGFAAAERFVAAGDQVVISGRRAEVIDRAVDCLQNGARALVCDAISPEDVLAFGRELPPSVDVLVNNAGGNTDFDLPEPIDLTSLANNWHANLDANLVSAVLVTSIVSDRLAPGGAVVNMGSIAADKGAGAYGAAKAALASWNVDLATELGPRGVTANVVAPGYVERTEYFRDRMTDTRRETLLDATKNGRAGSPEDIAGTVFFLASQDARHITAQVIAVNGGAWPSR